MADKGHGEATIAAAFRVSTLAVRQRLRLANGSPVILKAYEDSTISLEQLMAYCVTDDHARQNQVFAAINNTWNKGPDEIRRTPTEKSVSTDDKRVRFLPARTPTPRRAARSSATSFPARMTATCSMSRCSTGWSWNASLPNPSRSVPKAGTGSRPPLIFPGTRAVNSGAIAPVSPALTQEEAEESGQLADELDELESAADEDLDAESHERIAAIKSRLAELNAKLLSYSDEQKAKSGAFVSIDGDGALLVKRGYRRHADILAETTARPAPAGGESDFAPADEGDGAMNG